MAGQITNHLLTQAHTTRAPWPVTTAVACLPVLVLGMGAALTHMVHADSRQPLIPAATLAAHGTRTNQDRSLDPDGFAYARAAAAGLIATRQRISRRNLRAAGIKGSNVALGTLATTLRATADPPSPNLATNPGCRAEGRTNSTAHHK